MFRKGKFIPGEYYHIYDRTILNIPEFKSDRNCERLARAFLFANSTESTKAFQILRDRKDTTIEEIIKITRTGEKLVDILCYVIMPNHYHLLLRQIKENGISNFIHKCNISIAKYINIKKNRSGPLFESLFKAKHIPTNNYLLHLSLYIHLNPLDFLIGKEWREHKIKNWDLAKKKLLNYPWSSLKTFINEKCEDKILSGMEIILGQFKNRKEYELFLREWSKDSMAQIKDFVN